MRDPSRQPGFKAGVVISNFIQGCREAAQDFVTITRELAELQAIALAIQRDYDNSSASSILVEFRPQIAAILKNCDDVVVQTQGLRSTTRFLDALAARTKH